MLAHCTTKELCVSVDCIDSDDDDDDDDDDNDDDIAVAMAAAPVWGWSVGACVGVRVGATLGTVVGETVGACIHPHIRNDVTGNTDSHGWMCTCIMRSDGQGHQSSACLSVCMPVSLPGWTYPCTHICICMYECMNVPRMYA
jgi:hypothetical protein